MCKTGLSCVHQGEQGRVEDIHMDISRFEIVGSFTGYSSRASKSVTVDQINFLNKKAGKKARAIIAPLKELHRLPGEKSMA